MDLGIDGHVAVLTGGGRGLGAAIAMALGAEGARIVVWDLDHDSAQDVAEAVVAGGGEAIAVAGDVTDPSTVGEVVRGVLDRFGSIQILVNCAGFSRDAPVTEMTDQEWQDVIDVCLTAPFYVTRAVVPSMSAAGYGRIVNISSRARFGDVNKVNYVAAKAGLVGLTSALAMELGAAGITVNAVAPGFVETARTVGLPYFADLKARALQLSVTPRLGELADISDAVSYLVARQSGYITGEVVNIAGGRLR